ncbi:MAG: DUF92 domain-containing protein [Gemmatimonas sp.]
MPRAFPHHGRPDVVPHAPVTPVWPTSVGTGIIATVLAGGIAVTALRAGSLSPSGAVAATLVGAVAMMAGRPWGVFLVGWFVVASVASRLGRERKLVHAGDVVEKGAARDAAQVGANGGVFAVAAVVALVWPAQARAAALAAAGALVAAGADTLATEIGTLWRGRPFSLRRWTRVPAGTSGAVSLAGSAGMLVAAAGLAWMATVVGLVPIDALGAVTVAGVAGAATDTIIGAWWQARRWCPACHRETEQRVHRCGASTQPHGGVAELTNDAVNALCTVVGAAVAVFWR